MELEGEQLKAFEESIKFIESGNHRESFHSITSKAGCGKTYVGARVAEYFTRYPVAVAAISHKAKKVIKNRISTKNVEAFTFASLLGMRMNEETGKFTPDNFDGKEPPITRFPVIIIDEASMISDEALELIMHMKLPSAAVLFLGDEGQIRPIVDNKRKRDSTLSPVFSKGSVSKLYERRRQGAGHPILLASDEYWDKTKSDRPQLRQLQRENKSNDKGSIVYTGSLRDTLQELIPEYNAAVNMGNTDLVKMICYRNAERLRINAGVRKYVFNEPTEDFVPGDLMIMNSNFKPPALGQDELFQEESVYDEVDNSEEFVMLKVEETQIILDGNRFDMYNMTGRTENGLITLPVLPLDQRDRYNYLVKDLYNEAYDTKGAGRGKAFEKWRKVSDAIARAEHGYAITAHKAQGSTYETVAVHMNDMLSAPIHHQEISALIYTGMTRASKDCYMVNKEFTDTLVKKIKPQEPIEEE